MDPAFPPLHQPKHRWSLAQYQCMAAALLLLTLVLEPTRGIWDALDWMTYRGLQALLDQSGTLTYLCAFLNTRMGNWVQLGAMILSMLPWLLGASSRKELRERLALSSYYAVVFFAVYRLVNRMLIGHLLSIERASPSVLLTPFVHLQELYPAWKVKVLSYSSFPSDHAMQQILLVLFAWRYARKYTPQVLLVAVLFSLPRVFSGAHWLSDCLVGGLAIALVTYALFFVSPAEKVLIRPFQWVWSWLLWSPQMPATQGKCCKEQP